MWNRIAISIDSHLARGQDFKISPNSFLGQFCAQCKFSWKTGRTLKDLFNQNDSVLARGYDFKNPTKLILGTNFVHNVNFSGKFTKFSGILLIGMVVFIVHMGGIGPKFPLIFT